MSAYKPTNWLEGLFIGAHVWCTWRNNNGLMPAGRLFGFVWDIENPGVVFEFEQGNYLVRYFVSFDNLEDKWSDNTFLMDDTAEFIGAIPFRQFTLSLAHVQVCTKIKRDNRKVPVWSQYC